MKIVIKKEPKGMYYAEIKWVEGVYAQWESIDEVVENLWSVYEEVMKLVESELKNRVKKISWGWIFRRLEITV